MKKFEQFAKEKHYLLGVSPATLEWYKHSLRWLNSEDPDEAELKSAVVQMRETGCKASACNSYIRAINSYLKWSGSLLKVPKLKEEQRVLPTFSVEDIQKIAAWRPKDQGHRQIAAHAAVMPITDPHCTTHQTSLRRSSIHRPAWEGSCQFSTAPKLSSSNR